MSQYSGGTFISSVTPVVHDGGEPGQVDMKLGFHAKQPASLQSEQRTHVETTQSDPSLFRQQEQVNGTIKACWLRRNCSLLQREEEPHKRKHPRPCYELTQDQAFQLCKKKSGRQRKEEKKKSNTPAKGNVKNKSLGVKRLQNLAGHQENSNVTAEMNQRCTEEKTDWDSVKENREWRGLGGGGGHWFWQQGSLLPLWPSVVGGRLMSTTLFPGDSSCPDLSDICFWETMR